VADFCDPCPNDDPDDSDGDGVCDSNDICPGFDDNLDSDGDAVPDGCDVCPGGDDSIDGDGDGVADFCDPCPNDNPDDTDGDGVCDSNDICPGFDDNLDSDGDAVPDGCDSMLSLEECPDDLTILATSEQGEPVDFDPPAATGGFGNVAITVEPAPGSVFPIGTTTVTVTVVDDAGKTLACTFDVTVTQRVSPLILPP